VSALSEFDGKQGIAQQEEDGHELTASEEHSLIHRYGEDSPAARRGGINKLHREGLEEE